MSMLIKDELLDIDGIKNSKRDLLELFIRRTAVITSTQESLVEKIIKDQWKQANRASQSDTQISEFDFCNLGTFYISPSKARKRIKKLGDITKAMQKSDELTDKKKDEIAQQNDGIIKAIKFKTKTNED